MIFVELALQGIRGFPRLHRIKLKPGLNVARSDAPQQRKNLLDLLYHTLFPDPSRGQATTALADPNASQSRIALTFYGRDKQGYRMIRDTVTGATKLYRYSRDEKKYRLFSEVSTEAAQFVRVQQQLPDEVAYERLFVFDPQQVPSKGGRARTRSGAPLASGGQPPALSQGFGPAAHAREPSQVGGFGSSLNMMNALVQSELEGTSGGGSDVVSEAEKRNQLERLKADLAAVIRADEAQAELDNVQAKRAEIVGFAERLRAVRGEMHALEGQLNPAFVDLPDGIAERIRTFEERERRYGAENLKLSEEQARLHEEANRGTPLFSDVYFLAGFGGAAAFVGLAVLTQRPALAIANLPCALVAVGAGLRWVNDLESRQRLRLKAGSIDKQKERLGRNHELDTAATRKLIKRLGTRDPADLIRQVEAHEELKAAIATLQDERVQLERGSGLADERELNRLDALVAKLEAEVVAASGSLLGPDQLMRRIAALEKELGLPPSELPQREKTGDPLMLASETGLFRVDEILSGGVGQVPDPLPWMEPSVVVPRDRALPPMPAPGEAMPPTPDIPSGKRRETSVPGVVAHRSTGLDMPAPEVRQRRPRPPARVDDDPVDDGYGSGYGRGGGGRGPRGGGSQAAPGGSGPAPWLCVGMGGGGFGGFGAGGYGGGGGTDGQEPAALPDRSRDLVGAAVDILQVQVDDLGAQMAPRLGQYLAAFTDKRLRRAEFGPRGEVRVAPKEGDFIAYPELDDELIDLVDASIKMALVERVVREFRVPVLLDDPFIEFPKARRTLVGQMLAYISSATQVLLTTPVEDIHGNPIKLG